MESKKLFCLLTLVVSLLVIEDSMASRDLAENSPPDKNGNRIGVVGSELKRDKSRRGGGSDSGTVPVLPPATETTISQAGQPNTSESAIVIAPSNAEVDVSAAVSPTGATLEEQCHQHHHKNQP